MPLPKKLGIEAGQKVCLMNAPSSFERVLAAEQDVRITHDLRMPPVDVVVLFVETLADLEKRFAEIASRLHPHGGFWVAFPKRTHRATDITSEVVRRVALAAGMVDDKAASIGSWSGVRLVLRNEIRDAVMYRAEPPPPALSTRRRRPTAPARIARAKSGPGSAMRSARARSTK